MNKAQERSRNMKYGLLVAAIALLVYANSAGNGFVGDDHSVIRHNPVLQGPPLSLFGVIDTTSDTNYLPFYRPLTYMTFLIEQRLHDLNPFPMHLVNVLLHALNAFLVYLLARTLFPEQGQAVLVGLLFAVHPLHSEGVNFLAGGRNTMLACLFSLLAYLVHRESVARNGVIGAVAGSFLLLAGLLSKEVALAVVPCILLLEAGVWRESGIGLHSRPVFRTLPYAAALLCYFVIRWTTMSRYGVQGGILPGFGMPLEEGLSAAPDLLSRLLDNLYILPRYLLTVVWPTALSPRYIVPRDLQAMAPALVGGWIALTGILAWLLTRGRSKATLFGLLWAVAFWLPVSGIVYFSDVTMADRFLYIPAIGLWVIAADQLSKVFPSREAGRNAAVGAVIFVLLLLSGVTVRRNLDWKSDLTLNTRMVEQYPDNPHGHYNLGSAYVQRRQANDLQLAEREYERVRELDPDNRSVYTPLGYVRLEQGDFEGALEYYTAALAFAPDDRDARINRAIAYEHLGRYQEALKEYQYYLSLTGHNNIPGSREYAEQKVRALAGEHPK